MGEYHIPIHRKSKMAVRVIVFDSRESMKEFFEIQLGRPKSATRDTRALCSDLSWKEGYDDGSSKMIYDKTYVALICFVENDLDVELIAHEAVHAAHAFSNRTNLEWPDQKRSPEEAIAYPVGIITRLIYEKLKEEQFL
jgi:hypothetical protein